MSDFNEAMGYLALISAIRSAIGDDGQRMQPELIAYCRQLKSSEDTLVKVREQCEVKLSFETQDFPDETKSVFSLRIDGPPDLLRQLDELLGRG